MNKNPKSSSRVINPSGCSVKGRTKVSLKAVKKLKPLLHLAALTAISMKGQLQDYYQRKEENLKMRVLHAVPNKLVLRLFAVIPKIKNRKKFI